jgi:hypothetical protein
MTTNGLEIKKDTFLKLDEEGQRSVLYDYLNHMTKKLEKLEEKKSTEYRELMTVGGLFGFLGGLVAMAGKWIASG